MADTKEQLQKMKSHPGFIAALDQSGGSTPGALRAYGIKDGSWASDEEMFTIVHQMRTRIMTSPAFTGERILAAILSRARTTCGTSSGWCRSSRWTRAWSQSRTASS